MKKLMKVSLVLLVAVMFLFAGMSELFARGRSGGSSFSRPSSSRSTPSKSYSKPSSSKPSSSSTKPKSTSVKPSSSSRTTTAPKRTAAQQKSYEAAKKNGTASMTKQQSMQKFKSDPAMAKKYTSSYATKPATRPSHIPASTTVGGKTVNVTYNQTHGGYGYMGPSGTWMMYDAMSDAVMLSALMSQNHYYYQGHPSLGSTAVVHHSNAGMTILWVLLGLVGVVVVIAVIGSAMKS